MDNSHERKGVMQVTDATGTTATTTATPASDVSTTSKPRTSNKVPAPVLNAARTQVAATLARSIAKHLGMTIGEKEFRDVLRRKHGKQAARNKVAPATIARDMLTHYKAVKARRSGK